MEWSLGGALVGAGAALVVFWVAVVVVLWRHRPEELSAREVLRVLPDVLRLVRRLAADGTLPRSVRVRLWVLAVYLVLPIDLVPDVVPVIGYADDVVVVVLVLRAVVRAAGLQAVERHWPGTPAGLRAVLRLVGVAGPAAPDD